MTGIEQIKNKVALKAVEFIEDGQIIGLGSGSTASYAIKELGRRIREEGLNILGISTSNQSTSLAQDVGIPLTNLDQHSYLDIAIDGADQIDPHLNLIKGMGGALTREKIVDSMAKVLIIIVDETKLTNKLGSNQVVPVEVLPFARSYVVRKIKKIGGKAILRNGDTKEPFVTDNGNYIVDVDFKEIADSEALEKEVKIIPGVIEVGLFINMAHIVFVGHKTRVAKYTRKVEGNDK